MPGSNQCPAAIRPDLRTRPIISAAIALYRWNVTLLRWAWIVVRPVFAIFMAASLGELAVNLGRQYETALIASVVGRLASQGSPGGAPAANWLNAMVPEGLMQAAVLLVGVIALMTLIQFAFRAIDALANSRMMASLQSTLHDKLLGIGTRWHDREGNDTGGNVQIINLAPVVQQSLALAVKSPFVLGISVAASFALILQGLAQLPRTPLWVAVVAAIMLLGLPVLAWQLSQPVRQANESVVSAQKNVSTELLNSLSQPLAIQELGGVDQRSARMRERLQALAMARFRTAVAGEAADSFKGALPYLLQALFLVYAVISIVRAGGVSGSSLGGSLQAIVLIQGLVPETVGLILSIINIFTGVNQQWPMIASVGEVLDMAPPYEAPRAAGWPGDTNDIEFHKVSFGYGPSKRLVLDSIDYEFTPGVVTAIAGASGSGKSTIFQLLTRLREPTGGSVTVSGIELNSIRYDEVRRHIGIVHQSPPFLTDTVRANFQLVSMEASDAQIEAVCRKVGIWDLLRAKNPAAPLDQFMTRDGGGQNGFSGGERRRLAIARGLLTRPSILLFDEPTAGIDPHSLELVADAIKRAGAGITSIVIEHNLDFILGVADKVCVLSGGRFVETGNPRLLAEQPGPFRDLLLAVRRLAGDITVSTTSYPMPARSDYTDSDIRTSSITLVGQRFDVGSGVGHHPDAPPPG